MPVYPQAACKPCIHKAIGLFFVFEHAHHAGQAAFAFGFGHDGRAVFAAEQFDVVLRHFVYEATRGHELPLAHFFALHAVG